MSLAEFVGRRVRGLAENGGKRLEASPGGSDTGHRQPPQAAGHAEFSGRGSQRRVADVKRQKKEANPARPQEAVRRCASPSGPGEERQHVPEEAEQTPSDKT